MVRSHGQVSVQVKKIKRSGSGKTGSTTGAESVFLFSLSPAFSVPNKFNSYISLKLPLRALDRRAYLSDSVDSNNYDALHLL